MVRQPVRSSNLKSVGYDPERSVLEIEFKDGSVYRYKGVPEGLYLRLMSAPSQGSFFHTQIKENYPYQKVQ